jgi:hypothetical protein
VAGLELLGTAGTKPSTACGGGEEDKFKLRGQLIKKPYFRLILFMSID